MITRNMNAFLSKGLGRGNVTVVNTSNESKTYDGESSYWIQNNSSATSESDYINGMALLVGIDDTPPTFDDYKLGSQVVLDFTAQVKSFFTSVGEVFTITRTFCNDTSSSVTIKELGVYAGHDGSDGLFLLAHEILSTPVTIEAGECETFTFTLR